MHSAHEDDGRAALSLETRTAAVNAILERHPDSVVAALADDGFRIPLPDSFPVGAHQALAVPGDRQTMLDVVVPADRITVVAAWERTRSHGVGVALVHALGDPDTRLTLSMVDARSLYGVYMAVLAPDDEEPEAAPALSAGPLVVPSRPRQATMHKSMTGIITEVDANVTRMFGWTSEQMVSCRSTEFIHPEDHARAIASWMELVSGFGTQRVRVRHRCADGAWLWVEVEHVHNGAADPDQVDVLANVSDISDEMAAHEAVRHREQLFSRLAESLPTGILQLHQDGSAVYANERLGAILHTGRPTCTGELLANIAPGDRPAVEATIQAALTDGTDGELEVEVCSPRGPGSRRCALTIVAISGEEAQVLICVNDVTESVELREELRAQATHDALTGSLNRSAVVQSVEELLSAGGAPGPTVIFVDVDNFKPINDRLGHAAGDELLILLARRLRTLCRERDFVGRLGGDEFLLVCHGVEDRAGAGAIAERIRDALCHPFALSSGPVKLRASIGVAWPERETTADALIARADAAMYEAKRTRDGVPVFAAEVERAQAA